MALRGFKRWIFLGTVAFLALLTLAAWFYREDILQAALDPRQPYQVYDPPPAPNYARREAWALMPTDPARDGDLAADVFFIHPTTYNGGEHWNAPIDEAGANETLTRRMLPNYAGPFVKVGRIFAPRYRQASLYTRLTMRDDARDARRSAYGDVREAFQVFVQHSHGRPFVLAGVEQGGELAARLLAEEIAPNPELKGRLVAAYLINTPVLAQDYGVGAAVPGCASRERVGCVVAYASAVEGDAERERAILNRSLLWRGGQLEELAGREPLCVNPLLGSASTAAAPARENLGAANATDMEWGARPAFLQRQVGAQCVGGVLRVTKPKSDLLRPSGDWAERLKAPGFNLFYADLEADALSRVAAFRPE